MIKRVVAFVYVHLSDALIRIRIILANFCQNEEDVALRITSVEKVSTFSTLRQ